MRKMKKQILCMALASSLVLGGMSTGGFMMGETTVSAAETATTPTTSPSPTEKQQIKVYHGDNGFEETIDLTETLTLPAGTTKINVSGLKQNTIVKKLVVPASYVEPIALSEYEADPSLLVFLKSCSQLTTIEVEVGNPYYSAYDGLLYGMGSYVGTDYKLVYCPVMRSGEITLAAGMKMAANGVFANNQLITKVTLPAEMKNVPDGLFLGCTNLKEVVFGNKVVEIGIGTFKDCKSLSNVVLPSSVKNLRENAFYGCSSIQSLAIPNRLTVLDKGAISCGPQLTKVTVGKSNPVFGCDGKFIMSKDMKRIFVALPGITGKISIPDTVDTIDSCAFANCSGVTEIKMGNQVTKIGDSAFENCSKLTKVKLSDAIDIITLNVFKGCSSLVEFVVPTGIREIHKGAFGDCPALTKLVLPLSIKYCSEEMLEGSSEAIIYGEKKSYAQKYATYNSFGFEECITVPARAICKVTRSKDKKSCKVTWKKVKNAKYYEIYMAKKVDGKYKRIAKTKNAKVLSFSKKKLSKKKNYFFKVRTVRVVKGTRYVCAL